MLEQIVSTTARRLPNGKIEEKTVRIRTYASDSEYERATGMRTSFFEPINISKLLEAIDEYIENVENLEW